MQWVYYLIMERKGTMKKENNRITVSLGNIGTKRGVEKIRKVLQGKTWYNLQVDWSPDAGNWPVEVSTTYEDATELEVKDMILFVLASSL